VVEVPDPVGHHDSAGVRVFRQVAQLVPAVRGERQHRREAGPQAGQGQRDKLPAVRQLDEDVVPGLEAPAEQPDGQPVSDLGQFPVSKPGAAVGDPWFWRF
jgi:hypothetical protein